MNSSSQTFCKAGNHYLPFTDGELSHSKMWMICLEEICIQARNWTQTFQISEHHFQSIPFQSDTLGNLSGIAPLVSSQHSCCSSAPQSLGWIPHRGSHLIQRKFCFRDVYVTNIMNCNSFSKKITLQSDFSLNRFVVSQQTITWYRGGVQLIFRAVCHWDHMNAQIHVYYKLGDISDVTTNSVF